MSGINSVLELAPTGQWKNCKKTYLLDDLQLGSGMIAVWFPQMPLGSIRLVSGEVGDQMNNSDSFNLANESMMMKMKHKQIKQKSLKLIMKQLNQTFSLICSVNAFMSFTSFITKHNRANTFSISGRKIFPLNVASFLMSFFLLPSLFPCLQSLLWWYSNCWDKTCYKCCSS